MRDVGVSGAVLEAERQLGLGESDKLDVKRAAARRRLIVWIVGSLSPVMSFLLGYVAGMREEVVVSGYPLAAAMVGASCSTRKWYSVAAAGILIVSVAAFVAGFVLSDSNPVEYEQTTKYGVRQ